MDTPWGSSPRGGAARQLDALAGFANEELDPGYPVTRRNAANSQEHRMMPSNTLQEADRDHVGEDRRAAVGHERQRQPGDRHQPDRHPDVDERLEREPHGYARRDQHPEKVIGHRRHPDRPDDQDRQQPDDDRAPDEAELLAS